MGLDRFGLSGPDHEILKTLGFTPEKVVERYLKL
jgi:transketolase